MCIKNSPQKQSIMKILIQIIDQNEPYFVPPIPTQVDVGIWLYKESSKEFLARNRSTGEKSLWTRKEIEEKESKYHTAVSVDYPNIRILAT